MDKIDEQKIALEIAERIKIERVMRGISQEILATRLGTAQSKISKLETASKGGGVLNIGELINVANALGCSWEYLVTGKKEGNLIIERFYLDSILCNLCKSSLLYNEMQKYFPECEKWKRNSMINCKSSKNIIIN